MGAILDKLRGVPFFQFLRHPYTHIAAKNEEARCEAALAELKNTAPSLISNDCIAGVLMKNYRLPCKSPMVNCAMYPDDFIRYLANIEEYMHCELVEKDSDLPFPVGELKGESGDIEIRFMHYSTFSEAKKLWVRRSKRLDLNNMNIILDLNPYMKASPEAIKQFIRLPYNKVIITTDEYRNTPASHYIDVGEKIGIPGIMLKYKNLRGERYFDDFDFIRWLNEYGCTGQTD